MRPEHLNELLEKNLITEKQQVAPVSGDRKL
jgi:hypothetical protein